jgi:uncharacterized protein involved in type VI secretion and phage assembly
MQDALLQQIAQRDAQRRAWGKYRGFVVDNQDPQKMARVKLRVPALLGEAETDWALPCLPCGGLANQGFFAVPQVGAQLWVEFEGGSLDHPIWTGTFWQAAGDIPRGAGPAHHHAAAQPQGHTLLLEDKSGDEDVLLAHLGGAQLEMNKDGNLALTDQAGATLTLDAKNGKVVLQDANGNTLTLDSSGAKLEDANGNTVEMSASGVKVSSSAVVTLEASQVALGGSGGEPVIKGTSFLTLFATHVHPTAMGPRARPSRRAR